MYGLSKSQVHSVQYMYGLSKVTGTLSTVHVRFIESYRYTQYLQYIYGLSKVTGTFKVHKKLRFMTKYRYRFGNFVKVQVPTCTVFERITGTRTVYVKLLVRYMYTVQFK